MTDSGEIKKMSRRFNLALGGLALMFTLGACGQSGDEPVADITERVAIRPSGVAISSVEAQEVELIEPVYGTGTMAADRTTDVGPLVSGIIEQIFVQVGDRVDEGQPLFRTRQVDYAIARDEAEHAFNLAKAEAEKAARDVKRIERLRKQDVASQTRLDDVRTGHQVLTARLGIARATLAKARQDFEDTIVRSPFKGVVTWRYVDEGIFMNTRFGGGVSSAIVQVQQIDPIAAVIHIPEVHLSQVGLGTPGRIRVDGVDRVFTDKIDILNDRVDRQSRSVELRFVMPNPDYAIKPGLFARAEILPPARRALVIERRALLGTRSDYYVYIAVNGKAERRAVEIQEIDGLRAEVVRGLEAGERVLVGPNLPQLKDGVPIMIEAHHAAG
ncbi:MAG: efflux RND transporter periplasmic adaptor subunit [Sphingomonadales bacterium]